jgi:hypothetical protein
VKLPLAHLWYGGWRRRRSLHAVPVQLAIAVAIETLAQGGERVAPWLGLAHLVAAAA